MILGFTGTRNKLTNAQIGWLVDALNTDTDRVEAVHHGACVGADAYIHKTFLDIGVPIIVHPPSNERLLDTSCLVPHRLITVLPAEPYLIRNQAIVAACTELLAMPSEPEGPTGGTWYTVHFADRMMKSATIVFPDGQVERRQMPNLEGREGN